MDRPGAGDASFVKAFYEALYRGEIKPSVPVPLGFSYLVSLGYREEILSTLWSFPWELAHPCGCPVNHVKLKPSAKVLNLGGGIGLDAFYLLATVSGQFSVFVVNLDVAFPALSASRQWAGIFFKEHAPVRSEVSWISGDALCLPFRDQTFEVVILNGVFNICREKAKLFCEISRVLVPDGTLVIADLFVYKQLPEEIAADPNGLVWCVSGAVTFEDLLELAKISALNPPLFHEKHPIDDQFYRAVCSFRKTCS